MWYAGGMALEPIIPSLRMSHAMFNVSDEHFLLPSKPGLLLLRALQAFETLLQKHSEPA